MSKIVLPPLPGYGVLAKALGPELAMHMCVTKWKDGIDIEVLQRSVAEMLRARDLEVARVVLEAAGEALQDARVQLKHAKHAAAFDAATIIVRTLEVAHHE